jgi:hypothetical protein
MYITFIFILLKVIVFESGAGTIRSLSLQMALAQRFNEVTTDITHISSLEVNRKYPIERADSFTTRFGETMLLNIRNIATDQLCKVFLPQRYRAVFKDDDVQSINDGFVVCYLISKGKAPGSTAYQLAIE